MNLECFRELRRSAVHRRRRIIMNNDGLDFRPLTETNLKPATSAEEFLARRTKGLEGTLVDTISYGITPYGFGYVNHNNKVTDIVRKDGRGAIAAPGGWNHPDVLLDGKDCLEIIINFCHKHDIEIWASLRMNGVNDGWPINQRMPWNPKHPKRWLAQPLDMGGGFEEKAFLISEGALEHPERWLTRGSCGMFTGADYGREDVREKIFKIIEDICKRYDIDGIELDFLRAPIYFSANAHGKPDVGQENRDKMTELMRRIREMTEKVGMRRKRPIVIASRMPDDVQINGALGLETPVWLKKGLFDILIAGEAWRIRPWKETVELGHSHDVPVYACATCGLKTGTPPEVVYRGRALAAWASGVDGIYTFNEFNPKDSIWNELGDPQKLLELDRITLVDNAKISRHQMSHIKRLPKVSRFLVRPPRFPIHLSEGKERTFEFSTGEDGKKLHTSRTPHATLNLRFNYLEQGDHIDVLLNGHALDINDSIMNYPEPGWIVYRDVGPFLCKGDNLLSIRLKKRDPKAEVTLELADLYIHITAKVMNFDQKNLKPEQIDTVSVKDDSDRGLNNLAFLITEDTIKSPDKKITGLQQWLLDELNFARPRVSNMYKWIKIYHNYPEDPIEKPLHGWESLAMLFDAERMGDFCEKEMICAFFQRVDSGQLKGEIAIHTGYLAGTESLAAIVLRSRLLDNLEVVASLFGPDCALKGLMPFPIRFLRAENDGHLIPGAFALRLRGIVNQGVFNQEKECWEPIKIKEEDLINTTWKLKNE